MVGYFLNKAKIHLNKAKIHKYSIYFRFKALQGRSTSAMGEAHRIDNHIEKSPARANYIRDG